MKGLLVPGLQSVHCSSPVEFPKEPTAQGRHAVFKLAPRRGLYVPAPHDVQDDDELEPTLGLNVPASHSVQLMAGAPPGLNDPAAHGMQSDALRDPERELLVPAGQGVESPEPSGQKQPRAQGVGGDDDAGGQKDPAGQGRQPPVMLMKKPDRQPETRISTTLEIPPWFPPPNRARFETDVATM